MNPSSIDPQEISYYDRLADQWWDKRGKFWPLHRLNELRLMYLKKAICTHFGRDPEDIAPLTGLSIIDIGCGGGILSESMAKLGASVHGIDVVEKSITVARMHSQQQRLSIEYEYATAEAVSERNHKYDVVLNMEVVEHVGDLPLFMGACSRLVDEDGIMFVATINRNLQSWLVAIVGAEYLLGWLPKGTHAWHKFVKPVELVRLLDNHGLAVAATAGVRVNPLTRHFSLGKGLAVNYMLSASRRWKTTPGG